MEIFGVDEDDDIINSSGQNFAIPQLLYIQNNIAEIGGGRGVFANEDIPEGTLVLAEIPIAVWPDASSLDDPEILLAAIESICLSPDAFAASKTLHPTSLDSVDEHDRNRIMHIWSESTIDTLICHLSEHAVIITHNEIFCLALALQHNGFNSGMYCKVTLVNHSCRPNCIKFSPTSSTGWASEIWTTKAMKRGDELTICYCAPPEMSSASMHEYLKTHHRFACACLRCKASIPACNPDLQTMQEEVESIEQELRYLAVDETLDVIKTTRRMMTAADSMVATLQSLILSVSSVLEEDSIGLQIRIHKFAANAAAALLEAGESLNSVRGVNAGGKKLKSSVLHSAAFQFLRHSLLLRDAQLRFFGNAHPDLAGTFLDCDQGFSCVYRLIDQAEEVKQALLHESMAELPYSWAKNRVQIQAEWKRCRMDGLKLKKMFCRHPRYSSIASTLKRPGDYYIPM